MDFKKIAIALILLSLIVLIATFFLTQSKYKYSFESNGVLIASNYRNPNDYVPELASKNVFFISPELYRIGTQNSYMGNASNLFVVVLNGNDKNAVQLLQVLGEKKELDYCITNSGNPKTAIDLNRLDCISLLDGKFWNKVNVLIKLPDSSLSKPVVELAENEIIVMPKSFNDASNASFEILKAMYPNAETIRQKVNLIAGKKTK